MKTTPEDLRLINEFVLPGILGAKPFVEKSGSGFHMAYNEAAVFQAQLSNLRPECAIEVGTETGATLALIARYSQRAFSIDLDPQVKVSLEGKFPNVEFISGSSHVELPELLRRLTAAAITPDFIFIDGDHSAEGVRQDIEFVLSLRPTRQMTVLMHDSFNPECRKGMLAANWSRNAYCHLVDLDFSPGVLHPNESVQRQMWGGLGYALFLPEPRRQDLVVKTTHQLLFEAAFLRSVYCHSVKRR